MTRRQLDLLIRYANLKAHIAVKLARNEGVSPSTYDELAEIIGELEESIEEPT
jgi:hypothetical protein